MLRSRGTVQTSSLQRRNPLCWNLRDDNTRSSGDMEELRNQFIHVGAGLLLSAILVAVIRQRIPECAAHGNDCPPLHELPPETLTVQFSRRELSRPGQNLP